MYVVLFYKVIHWQLRDQTHVLVTALASFRTVARFFTLRCNTMRRHTKQGRRYKSLGKKLGCLDVKRTSKLLLLFFFVWQREYYIFQSFLRMTSQVNAFIEKERKHKSTLFVIGCLSLGNSKKRISNLLRHPDKCAQSEQKLLPS